MLVLSYPTGGPLLCCIHINFIPFWVSTSMHVLSQCIKSCLHVFVCKYTINNLLSVTGVSGSWNHKCRHFILLMFCQYRFIVSISYTRHHWGKYPGTKYMTVFQLYHSFDTCTSTICVYVKFCSFYCLACLLHIIIDTDHCVVVGRAIVWTTSYSKWMLCYNEM